MNIESSIGKIISDMSDTLHNDYIMQKIVDELAKKIYQSRIVKPIYKNKIMEYKNEFINKCECKNMNYVSKILSDTVIYFLSNLNIYDYNLINILMDSGLAAEHIIAILLLNNINDIEQYCDSLNMNPDMYYKTATLKKLSALHNLKNNY